MPYVAALAGGDSAARKAMAMRAAETTTAAFRMKRWEAIALIGLLRSRAVGARSHSTPAASEEPLGRKSGSSAAGAARRLAEIEPMTHHPSGRCVSGSLQQRSRQGAP